MSKAQEIQDWLRKYLFWVLCGLVAVLGLISWYLGNSKLFEESKKNTDKISGSFSKAREISTKKVIGEVHPNADINKQLEETKLRTVKTVNKTWQELYNKQKSAIYRWPEQGPGKLSGDFLDWLKKNPPTEEIPIDFLVEYGNQVKLEFKRLVTDVAVAAWPETLSGSVLPMTPMNQPPLTGSSSGTVTVDPKAPGINEKLIWVETDIAAHYARYNWSDRPASIQVRLAQEDLWVMEQLLALITRVNSVPAKEGAPVLDKSGRPILIVPHLRPIKVLERLAIECFAAEATPLGTGANRIFREAAAATGTPTAEASGETPAAPADGATEAAPAAVISAPPERRGAVGGGGAVSSGSSRENLGTETPSGATDGATSDPMATPAAGGDKLTEQLLAWRYVDNNFAPLSKAQLDSDEQKLDLCLKMPFQLRMHILQSAIPRLLEEFKNAPMPMEIRQYRENPDRGLDQMTGGGSSSASAGGILDSGSRSTAGSGAPTNLLPGEVLLELSGVVYLIRPFDEKLLSAGATSDSAGTDPAAAGN